MSSSPLNKEQLVELQNQHMISCSKCNAVPDDPYGICPTYTTYEDRIRSFSKRPTLEQYFMQLLPLLASRGTCVRRKVAAIVTDESGHLLGCGYNGPPSGAPHCIDFPCAGAKDQHGNTSRCEALHAEYNALMQAGSRLAQASRLYCSCTPCIECAKLITAADKIRKVFAFEIYTLEGVKYLLDHKVSVFHVHPNGHIAPITEAYFDPK